MTLRDLCAAIVAASLTGAAGPGLVTPASASNVIYHDIVPTPWIPDEDDGRIVVTLDQDGIWSNLQNSAVPFNIAIHVLADGDSIQSEAFYLKAGSVPDGWGANPGAFAGSITLQSDSDAIETLEAGDQLTHTISTHYSNVFPLDGIYNTPQGACHVKREQELAGGKSLHQVLSSDLTIDKLVLVTGELTVQFGGDTVVDVDHNYLDMKILCRGDPAIADQVAPHPDISATPMPEVTEIDTHLAVLEQYGPSGLCKLVLSGHIQADVGNVDISFRYEDKDGHQSEVHTVTTHPQTKYVNFSHKYSVPNNPDGPELGEVRIKGVSHSFQTPWKPYDMECVEPGPGGLTAILPPDATMDAVVVEKEMVGDQYCAKTIKLIGYLKGNGPVSGSVWFTTVGIMFNFQPYQIDLGGHLFFVEYWDLEWQPSFSGAEAGQPGAAGLMSQDATFGFHVRGEGGEIIASDPQKHYTFTCNEPRVNEALLGPGELTTGGAGGGTKAPRKITARPTTPQPTAPGGKTAAKTAQRTLSTTALALPDLVIDKAMVAPGKKKALKVRVVNAGQAKSKRTTLAGVYHRRNNKKIDRTIKVQALNPGQGVWLVIDFPRRVAKAKKIDLQVDKANRVKETDERNNGLIFQAKEPPKAETPTPPRQLLIPQSRKIGN